jgi:hypothetical protein
VAVVKLLAGAFVAYVLTRAAFIFLGWIVAVVVLGLAAVVVICWRQQQQRVVAVGLVAGTGLSLLALAV